MKLSTITILALFALTTSNAFAAADYRVCVTSQDVPNVILSYKDAEYNNLPNSVDRTEAMLSEGANPAAYVAGGKRTNRYRDADLIEYGWDNLIVRDTQTGVRVLEIPWRGSHRNLALTIYAQNPGPALIFDGKQVSSVKYWDCSHH